MSGDGLDNFVAKVSDMLPGIGNMIVPGLGGLIGTGLKLAAHALTGVSDDEGSLAAIDANPELKLKYEELVRTHIVNVMVQENNRLQIELADTASARNMLQTMVMAKSPIQWAPVVISTLVLAGFFWIIYLMFVQKVGMLVPELRDSFNQLVGALIAAFTTVISFWLGSSKGSKDMQNHIISLTQPGVK